MRELFYSSSFTGFKCTTQSEKFFNIICVSKHNDIERKHYYHLSVGGVAIVKQVVLARADIDISLTIVNFRGKDYQLSGVRAGLDRSCLVIRILNNDESPFNEWELYTDTPISSHDGSTSESIRAKATKAIAVGIKIGVF